MNFQLGGKSPLQARATLPIGKMIIIGILIIAVLFALWFIANKIKTYLHSDKFIEKIKNRNTTRKDVAIYSKNNTLSAKKENLLWDVCSVTNPKNINYNLKTINEITDLFREAYYKLREKNISEEKLNEFFLLQFRMESNLALSKGVASTSLLPLGTVVFYIAQSGEQFPLYVIKNTSDAFFLEIPEFLYNSPNKPKLLTKLRFSFKTQNGLTYTFNSRILRYEESRDEQYIISIAHTDELQCTAQRKYKRENITGNCKISPIQIIEEPDNSGNVFRFSSKVYDGKLTNISAGGCCIQTPLPIKKHQHICVVLESLDISEKIVGVIKNTEKMNNGDYALHIQFIRISPAARNRIFAIIYKYEI